MKLAEKLKEERLRHNLKQTELAGRIGIGRSTYLHLEKGAIKPSFIVVRKIANYFSVSEEEVRTWL